MRALQINKHKTNLTNILMDIYKDGSMGPALGFKGGTAALLFHNLPRFSTDLDFDLLPKYQADSAEADSLIKRLTRLFQTKYEIQDQSHKYQTLFWLLSYGVGLAKIKVEISTRDNPHNSYEHKTLFGVKIKTLKITDMIAHKMVALMERPSVANRDLFDVHFYLGTPHASDINCQIIQHRTGKSPKQFYKDLYAFVDRIPPQSVLAGLGEVLDQSQKDWAKTMLVQELLGLIERQLEYEK